MAPEHNFLEGIGLWHQFKSFRTYNSLFLLYFGPSTIALFNIKKNNSAQ